VLHGLLVQQRRAVLGVNRCGTGSESVAVDGSLEGRGERGQQVRRRQSEASAAPPLLSFALLLLFRSCHGLAPQGHQRRDGDGSELALDR